MSMGFLDAVRNLEHYTGPYIGVSVRHAAGGWQTGYGDYTRFPLASLTKLLTAVACLRINSKNPITAEMRELVLAAVSRHDRSASDRLTTSAGGIDAVNALLRNEGFHHLDLMADHASRQNCGTPHDLTMVLQQIHSGQLLSTPARALVLEAMRSQTDPDGVLSGLPAGASWAHMTGGLDDVCNDMGILETPAGTLFLTVCATGSIAWPQLEAAVGRVGALTYEHLLKPERRQSE